MGGWFFFNIYQTKREKNYWVEFNKSKWIKIDVSEIEKRKKMFKIVCCELWTWAFFYQILIFLTVSDKSKILMALDNENEPVHVDATVLELQVFFP